MKDVIISKKTKEKGMMSENIADMTAPAEVAEILSLDDLAERYN